MYCSHSETHKAGEFSAHPQSVVTLDMIYARCVIIVETWRLIYAHCVIIAETRRHSASSECCELPLPFHTGHFWQAVHSASAKCKVLKRKSKITKKNCTTGQLHNPKKLNTRTLGLSGLHSLFNQSANITESWTFAPPHPGHSALCHLGSLDNGKRKIKHSKLALSRQS